MTKTGSKRFKLNSSVSSVVDKSTTNDVLPTNIEQGVPSSNLGSLINHIAKSNIIKLSSRLKLKEVKI